MVALLAAMAALVVIYYWWPTGAAFLSWYGAWQHAGGILRTGLAAGFAGGILSELSLILLRDGGRFTRRHLENMGFRFAIFFVNGMIVSVFYDYQAVWFGMEPPGGCCFRKCSSINSSSRCFGPPGFRR